jgi:Selenocysteine lyase
MNREDFKIFDEHKDLIYFDSGATTLKPKQVLEAISDYYTKYTANAHRGDYDNSLKVDEMYEGVRDKIKDLINATNHKEIIFTKGTTESINMIVFGFMKKHLKQGDIVLLSKSEHASNVLPWIELQKELGIVIEYIPLDDNLHITMENVQKAIKEKTKVISLAHITNTIGDERPIKEIGELCKNNNIYFVVDGAQSIPHKKTDVKELNIDFLAASGHKMLGPTGIGILYGKEKLLEQTAPINFGGGMNTSFETTGEVVYSSLPARLEAGTGNIEGVIGLGSAIDYLNNIGFDNITAHINELKEYLISKLNEIENVIIYNKNATGNTVLFNLKDIFAQDTAVYLNHYHICVRAGNHCAKILKDELGIKNTCRISLYLYNTKEEIDKLIKVLKDSKNIFEVVI